MIWRPVKGRPYKLGDRPEIRSWRAGLYGPPFTV